MNLSKKEYDELTKLRSPNTKLYMTLPKAFVIGGLICVIGQALTDWYMALGMGQLEASTVTSITLIAISALMTGFGWYEKLARHGGGGTLIPITGFANAVVSPALEFKTEGYVLGVGAKMFIIAGPVIVYGITASVIYGVIFYLIRVVS